MSLTWALFSSGPARFIRHQFPVVVIQPCVLGTCRERALWLAGLYSNIFSSPWGLCPSHCRPISQSGRAHTHIWALLDKPVWRQTCEWCARVLWLQLNGAMPDRFSQSSGTHWCLCQWQSLNEKEAQNQGLTDHFSSSHQALVNYFTRKAFFVKTERKTSCVIFSPCMEEITR